MYILSHYKMYVYHGSSHDFDIAKPSDTSRWDRTSSGKLVRVYKGISLHATPYKWIGLSYIADKKISFTHNRKTYRFGKGVDVKTKNEGFYNKEVEILGKKSLEYSLEKLYGEGGYLYTFDAKHFKHIKGLGENEVMSLEEQKPLKKQFIKDPVKMMKKEGVKFIFVDLTKT